MNKWQRWTGIMKAYPFEEKRLAKWNPPYIIQPKYDGVRCRAVPVNDSYMLLSSEENIVYSVPHINEAFESLHLHSEFDGELYCRGMSFEEILSITSRTVNISPIHKVIQFHCFDIINDKIQAERINTISHLKDLNQYIEVAPYWICENLDEVKKVYDNVVALGYEGIIIRHIQAPYQCKRSIYVMKFKPKKRDTYTIVGWKEETSVEGVPKGRIGSLIMSSQSGDNFGVSAGLDADEKARLWGIRHELVGKLAIVHYQHLTNKKIPKGTFNIEVIYDKKTDRDLDN